ncbi:MAG: hypothetical protein F6K24_35095 [Okeania sp. SIO2D1]|nr:hypothetical protein [Okeania sp. SIO2D1]
MWGVWEVWGGWGEIKKYIFSPLREIVLTNFGSPATVMIGGDKQHLERKQDAPNGDNYNAPLPKFHPVIPI